MSSIERVISEQRAAAEASQRARAAYSQGRFKAATAYQLWAGQAYLRVEAARADMDPPAPLTPSQRIKQIHNAGDVAVVSRTLDGHFYNVTSVASLQSDDIERAAEQSQCPRLLKAVRRRKPLTILLDRADFPQLQVCALSGDASYPVSERAGSAIIDRLIARGAQS